MQSQTDISYSVDRIGFRYRDSNCQYNSVIAQNSNDTLAFYSPSNIGANGFRWVNGGTSNVLMTLDDNGNLDCIGDVTCFSSSISDSNFKHNIAPYTTWKQSLELLNPVTFTWNDDSPLQNKCGEFDIGLLAQEVAIAYPLAHDKKEIGNKSVEIVRYEKLIPLLLAALKDHEIRIKELEQSNNELKSLLLNSM